MAGWRAAIYNSLSRKCLSNEVMFGQRLEWSGRMCSVDIRWKNVPGRGEEQIAKSPRQESIGFEKGHSG